MNCSTCGYVVDVLRSCYRSTWNLPDLGQVDGIYYFAPPGAPLYPDFTYLMSRNWRMNDGSDPPEFGELESATQEYSRGHFPGPTPAFQWIGNLGVLGSELVGRDYGGFAGLTNGVDSRCFIPPPHS